MIKRLVAGVILYSFKYFTEGIFVENFIRIPFIYLRLFSFSLALYYLYSISCILQHLNLLITVACYISVIKIVKSVHFGRINVRFSLRD